ncbi:MAG: hypothetical protein QOH42_2721 [Blastocatellia bacterium]|jgi:hypothetical protein|nr:hypothetical protein [Blastocatellia bacterium]
MDKNRIGGVRRRASWQVTTKPISIKDAGCKSGGGALKAVELTSGELTLGRGVATGVIAMPSQDSVSNQHGPGRLSNAPALAIALPMLT